MRDYMSSFFAGWYYIRTAGRCQAVSLGKRENLYLLDYACRFCGAGRARTEKEYIAEKL